MLKDREIDDIKHFLAEDLGFGDITGEALIDEGTSVEAVILCKDEGLVAGLKEVQELFRLLGCESKNLIEDGTWVKPGHEILLIHGPAKNMLQGERVALNLLSRMSGIATATKRLIASVRGISETVKVAATRKTAPGLRSFDKRAVIVGGGDPHRFRLDDCILIKDNHLAIVGSITEAVRRARQRVSFTKKIEVEAKSIEEVLEAARVGSDIVMLDNFSPNEAERALRALEKEDLRNKVVLEASGEINESNIQDYARAGIDVISSGSITHSAKAMNMSLEVKKRI
ncbi:MAG: carboxylating nicotinate-nucleotide diphosphorylase [Candidatus Bathyarchaeia archaeon]